MSQINDYRNNLITAFHAKLVKGEIDPTEYAKQINAIKSIFKSLNERKQNV